MRKSIFFKLFVGIFLILLAFAGAVLLQSFGAIRTAYFEDQVRHLGNLNSALNSRLLPYVLENRREDLEAYVKELGAETEVRMTVIGRDGAVIADSEQAPERMESHQYRPEIFEALEGRVGQSVRFSSTVQSRMLYVGFPMKSNGEIVGVLRLSVFIRNLDALLARMRQKIIEAIGITLLILLLAVVLFSRSISKPVREFVAISRRVAGGDFEAKISRRHRGELGDFARSFNSMVDGLKAMFLAVERRTEELDSILSSIQDGLIVIDAKDAIVMGNEAFRKIVQGKDTAGRFYWEAVRSSGFAELIKSARESKMNGTGEIRVEGREFQCTLAFLRSQDRLVVTFHDLTEARDIERMKKDFVLNVSHELRTPLTAIKGFAETLEGRLAGEDKGFAGVIRRNTDRLISLVQDLLALSRLEEKGIRTVFEEVDVLALAENVVAIFGPQAAAKAVELDLNAEAGLLPIRGDAFQLEQMLINLVDNAVKYTDKGRIDVSLARRGKECVIDVRDTGIGIPEDHLPHIFERFYVADPSRSRKLGGTGLGLSIVKHVVLLHQGRIEVRSRPGEGTTFTVILPAIAG